MNVQIKNKEITFKYKLKRGENYKVNQDRNYKIISIYKKPRPVKGITSYCSDGQHILFLDYDKTMKWIVLQDYKRIQRLFGLPPAYLFTTKELSQDGEKYGNYHVICLVKNYPNRIYNILSTTHCDVNYTSMPQRNIFKNWVLRISNKGKRNRPKFVEIIGENVNLDEEISKAHFSFLHKIYKLPNVRYTKLDRGQKVFLQLYDTMNY